MKFVLLYLLVLAFSSLQADMNRFPNSYLFTMNGKSKILRESNSGRVLKSYFVDDEQQAIMALYHDLESQRFFVSVLGDIQEVNVQLFDKKLNLSEISKKEEVFLVENNLIGTEYENDEAKMSKITLGVSFSEKIFLQNGFLVIIKFVANKNDGRVKIAKFSNDEFEVVSRMAK